jgi:hypothetical protein
VDVKKEKEVNNNEKEMTQPRKRWSKCRRKKEDERKKDILCSSVVA